MKAILVFLMVFSTGCIHLLSSPYDREHPVAPFVAEGFICSAGIAANVVHEREKGYSSAPMFLFASTCTISLIADTAIEIMERNE